MSESNGTAAPDSGPNSSNDDEIPTFEELAADPEIAALLEFEPVPRSHPKANGWTAGIQRMFIAWLAHYGSATNACDELGKARSGIDKVYKSPDADEFRAAWAGAIALAEKRRIARIAAGRRGIGAMRAPVMSRKLSPSPPNEENWGERWGEGAEGEVRNEYGEWEDERSYRERGDEALDSIRSKLLRCRRMYLSEISASAGKRAAFEILTELPVDWDKAANLEPQPFEPWALASMREPDMLLTAEAGWIGIAANGRDKMAELQRAIDDYRAAEGLPAVDWED